MKVNLRTINPDVSVEHTDIDSTCVDGLFYCVLEKHITYKYRLDNIWVITENREEKANEN